MLSNLQQRYIKLTFGRWVRPEISQVFEARLGEQLPEFLQVRSQPLELLACLIQQMHQPDQLRLLMQDYAQRYPQYIAALPVIRQAWCMAIQEQLPGSLTPEMKGAWEAFYHHLAGLAHEVVSEISGR